VPVSLQVAPASPPTVGAPAPPAGRDRYIDLLRGVAILFVAIGHWLVVVPSFEDGHFDGVNALATVPAMRQLTWIFQVMPLFFIVGGYANGISWRGARRKGTTYADWLRTRLVRLLRPTLALLGVWVALGVVLRVAGIDPELVHTMAWLVVVPLWFLAVYVIVVAAAPALHRAHERWGVGVLVVLAALAVVVDWLRIGVGVDGVEHTNFFWVFLFAQQLGFFWLDGRLDRRRWAPAALFAGGVTTLWLLTHVGPYPVSLVGVPGETIANNAPPTITLLALGLAQAGFALLLRRPVSRWLERRRVWSGVIAVNAHAMTIHLWHFTALIVVAVVLLPLGVVPVHAAGSFGWWAVRVAAVVVFALPLLGLVVVFGRIERGALLAPAVASAPVPGGWRTARMLAATGLLAVMFLVVTLNGLSIVDSPAGLPVTAMVSGALGLALLGRATASAA
jgi:fucose 4-O-acetylase-like acetyltransferase